MAKIRSIRDAAYAGLREGARKYKSNEPKKKKRKPRQLSETELIRLRKVLAKEKVSEALY